ncbi:MAG TPA: transcriptional regulator [Oceanospirillales bacterium]|nr:transcriptional regulator [Oceanospirillaceae bacterium]HBS41205.1 transcriptional regulator [Oceanospirillales bacterium]|tara:strand:+ start:1131 stop:1442 length:312 start_codon:yes stop_codon:yes gene_type:complete
MNTTEDRIRTGLESLNPEFMQLENESHMHSGPATDSHFKVTLVSTAFSGKGLVARHQSVYGLLKDEMQGPVHALSLHLFTPEEWASNGTVPDSPQCMGGSKVG